MTHGEKVSVSREATVIPLTEGVVVRKKMFVNGRETLTELFLTNGELGGIEYVKENLE